MPEFRSREENYTPYLAGSWPLFDCLGREMQILAEKSSMKNMEEQLKNARRLLLRGVVYAYNDILLAMAQKEIALADMQYNEKMLEECQKKYEAQVVAYSDVLNFKIAVANGRLNLNNAEYTIKASRFVLAGLLGLHSGSLPESVTLDTLTDESRILPELPSLEHCLDTALAERPDLRG